MSKLKVDGMYFVEFVDSTYRIVCEPSKARVFKTLQELDDTIARIQSIFEDARIEVLNL